MHIVCIDYSYSVRCSRTSDAYILFNYDVQKKLVHSKNSYEKVCCTYNLPSPPHFKKTFQVLWRVSLVLKSYSIALSLSNMG